MTAVPSALAIAADYWDPPEDSGAAEDRELALECSRDLRVFIREAWPLLEPARPFVPAWHIDCVAEHLMAQTAGQIPRLLINQPPNSSKSITAAVSWPAWEWLTAAHIRWIYASYSQGFAYRDSRKMRDLIQSRGGKPTGTLFERRGYQGVLALLGQGWTLRDDQNAKGRYDTTAGGMRLAASVGSQVTGDHGDRLVIDDPTNPEQAYSDADRDRANRWWDSTMMSRFIDAKATATIVQQRLHEEDMTGHLLAATGWHHLCLPAEYVPAHPFTYPADTPFVLPSGEHVSGDPRTEGGELLDPVRLGEDVLAEKRRVPSVYAGQFLQQPTPVGGGLFRKDWYADRRWKTGFHRYLDLGWDRKAQSWDMAFKDTKGSDFVVGQLWGFHGADCYLLAQVRGRFDFTTTCYVVQALTNFDLEASWKLVEDKANGTAVMNHLRRKIGGLVPIEPKGSKYARASAVAPFSASRNVILPESDTIPCPEFYVGEGGERIPLEPTTVADWIHEHMVFPNGAHDDQVDAHSQALTWANPQPRPEPDSNPRPVPQSLMSGVLDMRA